MTTPQLQSTLIYTSNGETKTVLTTYLNDRGSGFDDLDIKEKIQDVNPFPFTDGTSKVSKHPNKQGCYAIVAMINGKPVDAIAVELTHVLVAHGRAFAMPELLIDVVDETLTPNKELTNP